MKSKNKKWMWISLIVVALIVGLVVGDFVFSENSSDRIPPQVKFISSSGCMNHQYGEFNVNTQKFYKFENCQYKIKNGEFWCSCWR